MSTFVNLQNARPGEYEKAIAEITEKNVCPFCPEHLAEFHPLPTEIRVYWYVTNNQYPYQSTKNHRVYIHREHIEHVSELSQEAWKELGEILEEETERLGITGGAFFMRFGDTRYTGASVTHLHAQLLQSNPDDPSYDPTKGVITRLG